MVIESLLELIGTVVVWLLEAMPHLGVPGFIASAASALSFVLGLLDGTSGWIPWTVLFAALALMIATLGIVVIVRGIRMTLSLLTGGGGGA